MASELAPEVMSGHNSKEVGFDCGAAGAERCCEKMRWNTVRQGSIGINGLFCEQEIPMNNEKHTAVGSPVAPASRKIKHQEKDCGSKEIIHQGLICGESSPNCSALLKGQIETPANEESEKLIQMKKEIRRESSFTSSVICEMNGFNKGCLQRQRWCCHASIDGGVAGGARQSTCVPDVEAQDLSQKGPRACQECTSTDNCNRSISAKDAGEKEFNTSQNARRIAERGGLCSEAGNAIFSSYSEEQQDCKEVGVTDKHAMLLEPNPAAGSSDVLCEGEARVSGECAMLPLIIREEDQSTEATKEKDSVKSSIRVESHSAEVRNEEGSSGSSTDDGFGSNENRTNSGTLLEEALLYALPYMSLQDILSMERVSKFFRDWVRNDVLLWQQLNIELPLSKKLTDEALLELAARSKGQLQCLSLVDCWRVTEGAVEHVVYSNPRLSKLCLPGCSRISPKAVLRMVKTHSDHRAPGMPGLKQLRLRNIYGLTKEHLDILLIMLGDGEQAQSVIQKPRFYHNGHYSLSCDEQRPIDVEECPKCSNVRLVYDCTRERCQKRQGNIFQECRGCILCIVRCEECGKCINDNDFEETFCLDLLCSSCWLRLPKCSECNRPGCGRHADQFIRTPETTFVCSDCCASPGASGPEFHVYAGFDI